MAERGSVRASTGSQGERDDSSRALLGGDRHQGGAERPQRDVQAGVKTISWLPKLSLSGLSGNLRTDLQNVRRIS